MAATRINDLAAIIDILDSQGRLARVKTEVDSRHELAGIARALEGGSRAVLFEKVKGHRWPVFAGLYWNRALLAGLLGRDAAALPHYVAACMARWLSAPADPVTAKSGPVLDVTEKDVDLGNIPVPVHALKDGGPYFDAAVVIAKDPETGLRNASIQRFQVAGRDTLRVKIDTGHPLEAYLEKAKRLDRNLWITLNCGVGPGLHFAASAPAEAALIERDALGLAGEFEGAPLELVPGTESDVEMAAHAMWALECEIVPGELAPEGPFAEAAGTYAPVAQHPVVHVRRVHRRERPIFQTMLAGMEMWNAAGLLGEAHLLALLQRQVPGVTDVHFTHGGAGCYHAVVQIAARRAGWSKQAILAAFAAFPPLKMVTVVDDDVDIRKAEDVEWAMATRLDPASGIVRIDNAFGDGLNPSFPGGLGPKVGFDATQTFPKRAEYERVAFKAVALDQYEISGPAPTLAAKPARAAPPPPIKPTASADWDENRWLKRELEAMKREGNGKAAPAAKPVPAQAAAEAVPDAAAAARKSKDWDEDRWLKRELEAMKREPAVKASMPAAKPPASKTHPVAPGAAAPPPLRAAERQPDDDEGSFFRGGAA